VPPSKTSIQMRNKELAKIHIAKKDLCLDRDTYEDILWTVCRVKSSSDLDSQGRFKLIKHFEALEWKPKRKSRANNDLKTKKIWSLWYQLKDAGKIQSASAKGLRSFVKKITKCDDIRFCDDAQKMMLIESLKKWLDRK